MCSAFTSQTVVFSVVENKTVVWNLAFMNKIFPSCMLHNVPVIFVCDDPPDHLNHRLSLHLLMITSVCGTVCFIAGYCSLPDIV